MLVSNVYCEAFTVESYVSHVGPPSQQAIAFCMYAGQLGV